MSDAALTNIKNGAKGPTYLARGLLCAVFTTEALIECHATGYGKSSECGKMLNQKGMRAIYKYVEVRSVRNKQWCPDGWTHAIDAKVRRSVTKKLNEIKTEHKLNLEFKKETSD